ncbi:hypothetical protein GCM10010233_56460 [Streptomyces pseudogriseolus]|nr:hypothetical protein GCM10010233_56460 [Streptomyces gancidicus]
MREVIAPPVAAQSTSGPLTSPSDVDRLEPGERVRFSFDANVGCFADAGAWATLAAPFRTYVDGNQVPRDSERLPGWCERVSDESQQPISSRPRQSRGVSSGWAAPGRATWPRSS